MAALRQLLVLAMVVGASHAASQISIAASLDGSSKASNVVGAIANKDVDFNFRAVNPGGGVDTAFTLSGDEEVSVLVLQQFADPGKQDVSYTKTLDVNTNFFGGENDLQMRTFINGYSSVSAFAQVITLTITSAPDGIQTGNSFAFELYPDVVSKVVIDSMSNTVVGREVSFRMEAFDSADNLASSGPNAFSGLVTFNLGGSASGPSTIGVSAGVGTAKFTSTKAEFVSVSISGSSLNGVNIVNNNQNILFAVGPTAKITMSSSTSKINQGQSFTLSLMATDQYGNVVAAEDRDINVDLSAGAGGETGGGALSWSNGAATKTITVPKAQNLVVKLKAGDDDVEGVALDATVSILVVVICDGVTEYQDVPDQITCKTVRAPCGIGEYQASAPSAFSDRDCQPCDGVTNYQPEADQQRCLTATPVCRPGTFTNVTLTAARDRVCSECPEGEYQDQPGQPQCKPIKGCGEGQQVKVEPSKENDRQCEDCPVGYVDQDSDFDTPCVPCAGTVGDSVAAPKGTALVDGVTWTFTQARFDAAVDVAFAPSAPGDNLTYFVHEHPVGPTGCPSTGGLYNDLDSRGHPKTSDAGITLTGADSILGRSLVAVDGEGNVVACGTIEDGRTATYQEQAGQTSCKPVTTCTVGFEESVSPSLSADRECVPCPGGSFQDEAHMRFCFAASTCGEGLKVKVPHTNSTDTECEGVTCPGLDAPQYGSISSCEGVQQYQAECTASCKNDRFDLLGTETRECQQAGVFSGVDAECKCNPLFYLDPVAEDCVDVCPTETYGVEGVCTACTAACEKGETFEILACDPTTDTNRVCQACKACPLGQFASGGCEGAQDTICSDFQPCEDGEFESTPGTATSDRICSPCTPCKTSEFAFTGCCGSEDTQCQKLSICLNQEFQLVAPEPALFGGFKSDRVCRKPTACTDTQYLRTPGNSTVDADCVDCTRCTNGTWTIKSCTTTADTECQAWKTCEAGEYIKVPGSPNNDVTCAACRSCGQHEIAVGGCGGSNQDTVCAPRPRCDAELEFEAAPGNTTHGPKCQPCKACEEDEFIVEACHGSTDTVCKKIVEKGAEELEGCPRGQYRLGDKPENSVCFACSPCTAGVNYAAGGLSCPTGFNSPRCEPVSTCVVGEELESKPPTALYDRVCRSCTVCGMGMVEVHGCNSTHDRLCRPWTPCPVGFYEQNPGDNKNDRVCAPCSVCSSGETVSKSCGGSHDVVCKKLRMCDTSQTLSKLGDTAHDTVCSECPSTAFGRSNDTHCPPTLVDVCAAPTTTTLPSTLAPTTSPDLSTGTKVTFSLEGDYEGVVTDEWTAALKLWTLDALGVDESRLRNFAVTQGSIVVSFTLHDPADGADAGDGHADAAKKLEDFLTQAGASFAFDGESYPVLASSISVEPLGAAATEAPSGSNAGAIAGGVVAGVALIAIIALVVVYKRKQDNTVKPKADSEEIDASSLEMRDVEKQASSGLVSNPVYGNQVHDENENLRKELETMRAKLAEKDQAKKQHRKNRTAQQVLDAAIAAKLRQQNEQLEKEISSMKQQLKKQKEKSAFQAAATQHVRLKAAKAALEEELAAVDHVTTVAQDAVDELMERESFEVERAKRDQQ